jgi:hypothetical protein
LLDRLLELDWVTRDASTRALRLTSDRRVNLTTLLGVGLR